MPKKIDFPSVSFDKCIAILSAVHNSGKSLKRAELAGIMNRSDSGGFINEVSSANKHGLIAHSSGFITITELGRQICEANKSEAKSALLKSFFEIDIYNAVYQLYKDSVVPFDDLPHVLQSKFGIAQSKARGLSDCYKVGATAIGILNACRFDLEAVVFPGDLRTKGEGASYHRSSEREVAIDIKAGEHALSSVVRTKDDLSRVFKVLEALLFKE